MVVVVVVLAVHMALGIRPSPRQDGSLLSLVSALVSPTSIMAVLYLHRMQLAAALLAARTVAFNLDGANLVAETGAADPFRVGSGAVDATRIYDEKIEN